MMKKDLWPPIGHNAPNSLQKHGILMFVDVKQMLARVQKDNETPPQGVIEQLLNAVITYVERVKNGFTSGHLLSAIDKLAAIVGRNHETIEKNTTVIRKAITDIFFSSFSISLALSGTRSWFFILFFSQGRIPIAASAIKLKPKLNKETEIVIRLNNKEKKQELNKQDAEIILKAINVKIAELQITNKESRAIKQLQSGDYAVHTINEEEAEKLRRNTT